MSMSDLVKEKIYEGMIGGSGWTLTETLLIFLAACLIGIYIFMVYKSTSKAAFYSRDLNITMAGIVIVVTAIMIAMQSSLIVSLGMVGALSIVRFRNAVKNPIDLLYLFWAVSAGIICGVGLYLLAIVFCAVMTIMLLLLESIPVSRANALLVLHSADKDIDWTEIKKLIGKYCKYYKEKSRNIRDDETEVIFEIRPSKEEELLKELKNLKSIQNVNYLSHDGEYRI